MLGGEATSEAPVIAEAAVPTTTATGNVADPASVRLQRAEAASASVEDIRRVLLDTATGANKQLWTTGRSCGAGLQAQRRAMLSECERRGWHLVEVIEDAGFSAKEMKRPGVQEALRVLEEGKASALVVAKLDRLSRSMIDFTALMGTAQKQH